ncbi:MAG TPA: hypothetical protein VGF94_00595 [Kofleriaceae bacterium]
MARIAAADPKHLALPAEEIEKIASEQPPLAPRAIAHEDGQLADSSSARGVDAALVELVAHASALATRLTGLGRPLGAYAQVGDAPRVVVVGLRFGAPAYWPVAAPSGRP